MLQKEEIKTIFIVTLVLGFALSLKGNLKEFHIFIGLIFLILMINIFAKKITAYYLDSEIEIKMWGIERFGFFHWFNISPLRTHPSKKFEKNFPIGIIMPLITAILTLGNLVWTASATFDVKKKIYRAAKRYELYSFSEMTEYHIGVIAFVGVLANIAFAIIGYLMGWNEFSNLNILFAFFNSIPISSLDGNKVFFGSLIMWSFLASIVLISMGYLLLVI